MEMKRLNKTQSIIMLVGAVLMVAGAGGYVFTGAAALSWIFAAGAIAFAAMQMLQSYEGRDITLRRLRRIMIFGDVMFLLSAVLMVENAYKFILPLFLNYMENGYYTYLSCIHNNWVVTLLVAAILEVYTTHRISNELGKGEKEEK